MKTLSWIDFTLGAWLVVVGFAISGGFAQIMTEEILAGSAIACLAIASARRPRNLILSLLLAMTGLWTLLAPGVINYTNRTASTANDMAVGVAIFFFGLASALHGRSPAQKHIRPARG